MFLFCFSIRPIYSCAFRSLPFHCYSGVQLKFLEPIFAISDSFKNSRVHCNSYSLYCLDSIQSVWFDWETISFRKRILIVKCQMDTLRTWTVARVFSFQFNSPKWDVKISLFKLSPKYQKYFTYDSVSCSQKSYRQSLWKCWVYWQFFVEMYSLHQNLGEEFHSCRAIRLLYESKQLNELSFEQLNDDVCLHESDKDLITTT